MKNIRLIDHVIEIDVTRSYVYDIDLERVKDDQESGRMNWLFHLRSKNWFTKDMETQIKRLAELAGVKLIDLGQ